MTVNCSDECFHLVILDFNGIEVLLLCETIGIQIIRELIVF